MYKKGFFSLAPALSRRIAFLITGTVILRIQSGVWEVFATEGSFYVQPPLPLLIQGGEFFLHPFLPSKRHVSFIYNLYIAYLILYYYYKFKI